MGYCSDPSFEIIVSFSSIINVFLMIFFPVFLFPLSRLLIPPSNVITTRAAVLTSHQRYFVAQFKSELIPKQDITMNERRSS